MTAYINFIRLEELGRLAMRDIVLICSLLQGLLACLQPAVTPTKDAAEALLG